MRIGYIRTSTGDQTGAGQRHALTIAGCERIYHDRGVLGGAVTKPQLEKALRAASAGDALVVTRLVRLARSMKFLIDDVERIGALGVDFVSLHEAIDTTTPGGRLFFHISAAFAQFERDVIRQRTKEGMAAAKRAGRPVGRPAAITDERWVGIKRMLDTGMTITEAARTAVVPRQAIYRRLKAEETLENKHAPAVLTLPRQQNQQWEQVRQAQHLCPS